MNKEMTVKFSPVDVYRLLFYYYYLLSENKYKKFVLIIEIENEMMKKVIGYIKL